MNTNRTAITAMLILSTFASAQTSQPAEEPNPVRLHEGGGTEYKSLETVGLSPEQRQIIDQKIAERTDALKTWVDSEKGQELIRVRTELAQARREKKTERVADLRKQTTALSDEYFQLRIKTRLAILHVLTPEQLAQFAGRALRSRATQGWESVELTPEQSADIDKRVTERAAAYLKENPIDGDAFFSKMEAIRPAVRKELAEQVLTAEQKNRLRAASTTRGTTRPTTRPAPAAESPVAVPQ